MVGCGEADVGVGIEVEAEAGQRMYLGEVSKDSPWCLIFVVSGEGGGTVAKVLYSGEELARGGDGLEGVAALRLAKAIRLRQINDNYTRASVY